MSEIEHVRRVPPRVSAAEYEQKLANKNQSIEGLEIPDPTPMAPAVGFFRQPTMVEHMRAMVKGELLRQAAEAAGAETFEEADDFEVEDELVPTSGFENDPQFEPPLPVEDPGDSAVRAEPEPAPSGPGKDGPRNSEKAPAASDPPAAPSAAAADGKPSGGKP